MPHYHPYTQTHTNFTFTFIILICVRMCFVFRLSTDSILRFFSSDNSACVLQSRLCLYENNQIEYFLIGYFNKQTKLFNFGNKILRKVRELAFVALIKAFLNQQLLIINFWPCLVSFVLLVHLN